MARGKKSKNLRQKLRQTTSKVAPSVWNADTAAELPFPPIKKTSNIYKMFQGTSSDMPSREVLSTQEDDVEKIDAKGKHCLNLYKIF